MQHWNSINYNMKCLIDSSIKDAILHSGLSDIELGQKLNVSRTTILKWRTRNSYKIRSSNAVALADLLDKEISFDKGVVSFINKQINFTAKNVDTNGDSMEIKTEDLINDLRKDKELLYKTIEQKDKDILSHLKKISELEKKLDSVKEVLNIPQIDHQQLQCVVNLSSRTFQIVSSAMAEIVGYSPIEMLRSDFDMMNLLVDTSVLKFDEKQAVISPSIKGSGNIQYWGLKTKAGKGVYIKIQIKMISDVLVFIDGEKISKSEYEDHISSFKLSGDFN